MYTTYLQSKERNQLGLSFSQSHLEVQMKDLKVASKQDKEAKKCGQKSNKALIQEDNERLVNSGKIMPMSEAFPPLKS